MNTFEYVPILVENGKIPIVCSRGGRQLEKPTRVRIPSVAFETTPTGVEPFDPSATVKPPVSLEPQHSLHVPINGESDSLSIKYQ